MPLYKYNKVTDQYTTYELRQPDYIANPDIVRYQELVTINSTTYVLIPDVNTLLSQHSNVTKTLDLVVDIPENLITESPFLQLTQARLAGDVDTVRYSAEDASLLMSVDDLNLFQSDELVNHITECRAWDEKE